MVLTSNLTAQIGSTIRLLILSRLWARNIRHQPRLSQRMVWKLLTQASELAKTISPSLIHLVSLVEKIRIIILRMRSQQKASSRIRRKIWVRSKVHWQKLKYKMTPIRPSVRILTLLCWAMEAQRFRTGIQRTARPSTPPMQACLIKAQPRMQLAAWIRQHNSALLMLSFKNSRSIKSQERLPLRWSEVAITKIPHRQENHSKSSTTAQWAPR